MKVFDYLCATKKVHSHFYASDNGWEVSVGPINRNIHLALCASSLVYSFFFGKGKLYLFQEEYIEVIHRLENFPASAERAHNL
jgi:hypothetical protein